MNFEFLKINSVIYYLLIFAFILFPFLGILSIHSNLFVGYRYLSLILIIALSIFLIPFYKQRLSLPKEQIIFFFYVLYCSLHFIGDVSSPLILDGFRYELVYMLMALFFLFLPFNTLPNLKLLSKIIYVQGLIVIFFSFWQLYDISILEVLYKSNLEDIGDIKLAIGYRLVSLLENPINLGAFFIIVFISINYYKEYFEKLWFLWFQVLTLVILLLVFATLSRLALLSFIAVLTVYLLKNQSSMKIIFFILIFSTLLLVATYFLYEEYEYLFLRFEKLTSLAEYTENSRLSNWSDAISKLNLQFLWGLGLGASTPTYSKQVLYGGIQVENSFITILIQFGFIGLIMYLLVIYRFFKLSKLINKYDKNSSTFILLFVVFFITMSLGNDFNRNSPFVFYFWFFYAYSEKLFYYYKLRFGDNK